MILYTPVPLEQIWEGMDEQTEHFQEIEVEGITMQVQAVDARTATIVRIISSDPAHYMHPKLQPGCQVSYRPALAQD
ncbi:YlzJ-like family protein [Marinicrinis sediminis]|uniref:YlzJ-like family protein n=1 Tax=Marinicrinis sediminis TaxID=1652465 RepID=A0ABW5R5L5_9BACL